MPARGMPPSRLPGPPAASGAALMGGTGVGLGGRTKPGTAPLQAAGTASLPMEAALPSPAATEGAAPPPSMPPRPDRPLGAAAAAPATAPPMAPVDLAIWTPLLPIPTEKYGRPSVL